MNWAGSGSSTAPLGRRIVGLVFGLPIRSAVTHQPDKLVALREDPCTFNPEAVPLPQRIDACLPGADEVVHLAPVDRVHPQLRRHLESSVSSSQCTVSSSPRTD